MVNRLRDGWTNRAETWWEGQGHVSEGPRKGIFWIFVVGQDQVGGPQVPLLGRGDNKGTPNWD